MTRILALLDDRAGNNAQVLGVAEKLGLPYTRITLSYTVLARLPNFLLGATAAHLSAQSRKQLADQMTGESLIVLSAGRRQAPVARWIKKQNPQAFLCHLMSPDSGWEAFDLVALAEHDLQRHGGRHLKHILPLLLSPHGVTAEKLAAARKEWEPRFAHLPHPRLGVLIGGTSKHATFTWSDYLLLTGQMAEAAKQTGGSLLITTSRRTDGEGDMALENMQGYFPADRLFLYSYGDEGENPYLGILACADALAVTADSISMLSEAVGAGKPLYIIAPAKLAPKFDRFARGLYERGIARPFALPLDEVWQPMPAPDAAEVVARRIRDYLKIDEL